MNSFTYCEYLYRSMSPTESISSKQSSNVTTPRLLTPSNPINNSEPFHLILSIEYL